MMILGLGGLLGDAACAVLKDGELQAAIEENEARHVLRGPAGCRRRRSRNACAWRASAAMQVDCVAMVRPFARGPESHCTSSLRDQFPKAEIAVVEHHLAHAASAFFASPFEEATVLTLDHAGDFRCGARWQRAGQSDCSSKSEWYYPDSLGRLYGAVTRAARVSRRRRRTQGPVALDVGRRALRAAVPRDAWRRRRAWIASFFDGHRQRKAASARNSSSGWGSRTAPRFPQPWRRRSRAGCRRRSKKRCWRWPARARICAWRAGCSKRAAGGVPGALRPLEERLRAAGGGQRRDGAGRGVSRLAPGPAATRAAARCNRCCSGPSYGARRDQAGAGELQAAIPLSALDRRHAGRRRCACWASTRSSPGCRGAWSSARARWAIAAFWLRRSIRIPPKI